MATETQNRGSTGQAETIQFAGKTLPKSSETLSELTHALNEVIRLRPNVNKELSVAMANAAIGGLTDAQARDLKTALHTSIDAMVDGAVAVDRAGWSLGADVNITLDPEGTGSRVGENVNYRAIRAAIFGEGPMLKRIISKASSFRRRLTGSSTR